MIYGIWGTIRPPNCPISTCILVGAQFELTRVCVQQPGIILLREGTDTSQGKGQIISNINAVCAVADAVRTTLGPRGMDKLIRQDEKNAIVSNDGATIMRELNVVHPAASVLVDIAKSQDDEIGDGTTTVVLLAAEMLRQCKDLIEDGVHPQLIIRAYRKAGAMAIERIRQIQVSVADADNATQRDMLLKCAATSLNSKLISTQKHFFAEMTVRAVELLGADLSLNDIGIKQVQGGALEDSILVEGVAFPKTFSYAGFEQQPKSFEGARIALLNVELELKAEKENAEVRIEKVEDFQAFVDAEWDIIYGKLAKIVDTGANIVLSKLPIGDLATQYFSDRGMFCAGRVDDADLKRVAKATGGVVQTTVSDLKAEVLGRCDTFYERQIGSERYNIFSGCPLTKTATIVLRGGAKQFIAETERSLHDAIMVVRRCVKSKAVVAGGGAVEMEISRYMREQSRLIRGKEQLFMSTFARALEVIPRQLSENAGFDSTDILNQLRHKHATGGQDGMWFGIDMKTEGITDTLKSFVWEPASSKINSIGSAVEATCLILSVDETVRNPQSEKPPGLGDGPGGPRGGMGGMRGRGRGGRGIRHYRGRGGQ